MLYPCGSGFIFNKIRLNSIKFVITGSDRRMRVCNRSRAPNEQWALKHSVENYNSLYNYFFMIEIIRTARFIILATHLRKIGISVPPYVGSSTEIAVIK